MPASDRTIETEVAVLGGGTSGCVIAGRLAEAGRSASRRGGPDYGPLAGGGWPEELVDARAIPATHDWGYDSADRYLDRLAPFQRARVLGGCSAHNGCIAAVGHRSDYDAWGLPGWSSADVEALLQRCSSGCASVPTRTTRQALSTPPASKPPRRRAGIARTTSASSTVSTGSVSRPSTSTPAFASTRPLRISIRSVRRSRCSIARSSTVSSAARMAGGPTSYATTRR